MPWEIFTPEARVRAKQSRAKILEGSHSGRVRQLGKLVDRKVSRVRIPYPPPDFGTVSEWSNVLLC